MEGNILKQEVITTIFTCDICEKESTFPTEFHTNNYAVLYVAYMSETGNLSPAELSSYEKKELDLCKECFEKSLDEVIKMKTIAYHDKPVYGFWKYNEIKFS